MLKKANMNWTCKTLINQIKKGNVNFDCAVQRGHVWDNDKKSLLIHSMLANYPIPALYFAKNEDGLYDALDGKQRCTAISQFINDDFELPADFPVVFDDSGKKEDFSGCCFDNLPEWAQDAILDYSMTIYYFEDITDDEVREMFFRLNNGKPLTAIELTRVRADSLSSFQNIAKHPAISDSVTDKGKARYNDENIAMQMWVMCYENEPDFSTKAFRPVIEKAIVTNEQMEEINSALDYVKAFHDSLNMEGMESKETKRIARKAKSKTHLVSLCYLAKKAIENGISGEDFNTIAYNFFNTTDTSASPVYNSTVGAGASKKESIRKRMEVMDSLIADNSNETECDEQEDEQEQ